MAILATSSSLPSCTWPHKLEGTPQGIATWEGLQESSSERPVPVCLGWLMPTLAG